MDFVNFYETRMECLRMAFTIIAAGEYKSSIPVEEVLAVASQIEQWIYAQRVYTNTVNTINGN